MYDTLKLDDLDLDIYLSNSRYLELLKNLCRVVSLLNFIESIETSAVDFLYINLYILIINYK